MARLSVCKYQSYQRKIDDDCDMPKVICKKINNLCVAQKYCPELKKFVVSEKSGIVCKYFENGFNK